MITYKIYQTPSGHDSNDVRFIVDGKEVGFGYIAKKGETFGLIKCPACGKKNYAMSVALGICAWCGFNVTKTKIDI